MGLDHHRNPYEQDVRGEAGLFFIRYTSLGKVDERLIGKGKVGHFPTASLPELLHQSSPWGHVQVIPRHPLQKVDRVHSRVEGIIGCEIDEKCSTFPLNGLQSFRRDVGTLDNQGDRGPKYSDLLDECTIERPVRQWPATEDPERHLV